MTNETHDRTHELLCAYVLDEADAAERAELEQLLAHSAELRAEKARIEATIGLVKSSLGRDDALSPAARDEVLRAALPPIQETHPWWRQSWVRAAAGILFCSLALGGWTVYDMNRSAKSSSELASRDADYERGRSLDGTHDTRVLRKAGLASESARTPAGEAAEAANFEKRRQAGDDIAQLGLEKDQLDAKQNGQWSARDADAGEDKLEELLDREAAAARPAAPADARTQDFDVQVAQGAGVHPGAVPDPSAASASNTGTYRGAGNTVPPDMVTRALFGELQPTAPAQQPQANVLHITENKNPAQPGTSEVLVDSLRGALGQRPEGARTKEADRGGQPTAGGGGGGSLQGLGYGGASGPVNLPLASESKKSDVSMGPARVPASTPTGGLTAPDPIPTVPMPPGEAPGLAARFQFEQQQGNWHRTFLELEASNVIQLDTLRFHSPEAWAAASQRYSDEDRFVLERLGIEPARWHEHPVTPDQRNRFRGEYVDHWCQRIVIDCRRRPDEKPRDMFFRFWGDNPFEFAAVDALSTFSADVDTASYTLARRYIEEGKLPEKAQIRTEEFVNYFKSDVPAPTQGTFAVHTTLAPSRFGAAAPGEYAQGERDLLRVVVRGKDVAKAERKPLALTFVVDCSGSMKEQNRIEMVKHAMRLLVTQLDARDSIAIVKFSTDAALVLPMTSCKDKALIEAAIQPLAAEGSTNSEAGLRMGYGAALAGLNREATNRVVFLSDGVANVGVTDPNVISEGVRQIREQGVYLNTVGVGMNNHNDVLLEQLADKADGVCNYVDDAAEAKKVFVDDFMGTVETIARDVKLQVEFDPAQVYRYRLLGYENRAVADVDFRNDRVDAGEVGAGHQVTALYEIEYAERKPNAATTDRPLATVRVRFKAPRKPGEPLANEEASEIAAPVKYAQRTSWEGAGAGYRRSVVVGQFAEFLRRSVNARSDSYDQLLSDARKLAAEGADVEFQKFVTLIEQARVIILNGWPGVQDPLELAVEGLRQNGYRRELALLDKNQTLLDTLEKHNRELEQLLRDTLRQRLEQPR